MTAAVWRRRFSSGGSRSMRAANIACTVAGTWMVEGLCQTVGAWHTNQHARLDQGTHALFQEEGIPLRTRDQEAFERFQTGVVPQQGLEEAPLAGGSGSSRTCV